MNQNQTNKLLKVFKEIQSLLVMSYIYDLTNFHKRAQYGHSNNITNRSECLKIQGFYSLHMHLLFSAPDYDTLNKIKDIYRSYALDGVISDENDLRNIYIVASFENKIDVEQLYNEIVNIIEEKNIRQAYYASGVMGSNLLNDIQ
jgi:hypothetical protein